MLLVDERRVEHRERGEGISRLWMLPLVLASLIDDVERFGVFGGVSPPFGGPPFAEGSTCSLFLSSDLHIVTNEAIAVPQNTKKWAKHTQEIH